jgi:hypothetical protein
MQRGWGWLAFVDGSDDGPEGEVFAVGRVVAVGAAVGEAATPAPGSSKAFMRVIRYLLTSTEPGCRP